jgi:polyvinyl alcohol dehydrogenase (cytochrome)
MSERHAYWAIFLAALLCTVSELRAQSTVGDNLGATLFKNHCSSCHESDDEDVRAPAPEVLKTMRPEQIISALERGVMRNQGSDRSRAERRMIAEYLTGKKASDEYRLTMPQSAYCSANPDTSNLPPISAEAPGKFWNGWGVDLNNSHFQPQEMAGLSVGDLPNLKLKWAFAFPGASSASSQPTVWGGRLFVGSWEGDFYSLDARTGCIHWMIETEAGVRTAATLGKAKDGKLVLYVGDLSANVYAIDAASGKVRWKERVDDYPIARISGSVALYNGSVYVPVSSREESQVVPNYPCCKFRGSVVSLDAETGKRIWRTYTISEPARPTGKNKAGTQIYGPAGVAVWVAPTIDPKRGVLYVGTGNDYSPPSTRHSDAIVAFDLKNGAIRWSKQLTSNDIWNASCRGSGDPATCPDLTAPDYDFPGSPILVHLKNGRDLILAGQKSAVVYALDPDKDGEMVWFANIGKGGTQGGIMFGPAADADTVYAALSDFTRDFSKPGSPEVSTSEGGGLAAINILDGRKKWQVSKAPSACVNRKPCSPAQAAAVSVIPGVVFSGSVDGYVRAYSTMDGKILWEYDTVRDFQTANGVKGRGGSINNAGATIVDGMVFTNSGYSHHSGVIPGNVLLAFGVD